MAEVSHQKSDDELWVLLDRRGLWLVYGGGVVAEEETLHRALARARDLVARGGSINEIVSASGDGITILMDQIHRLWERLDSDP